MDEKQLRQHLAETTAYIEQHRARVSPGGYVMRDMPGASNGFGPKAPLNDGAVILADEEGGTIGRLARYCQEQGTIPRFPLKGFWWVKGRCLGLKSGDDLRELRAVIGQLKLYAAEIVATEGVGPYLRAMADIRHVSQEMFPNERMEWLTMEQAAKFTGRNPETIRKWIAAGGIPTLDDRWGFMVSREHLNIRMAIAYANRLRGARMAREKRNNKAA